MLHSCWNVCNSRWFFHNFNFKISRSRFLFWKLVFVSSTRWIFISSPFSFLSYSQVSPPKFFENLIVSQSSPHGGTETGCSRQYKLTTKRLFNRFKTVIPDLSCKRQFSAKFTTNKSRLYFFSFSILNIYTVANVYVCVCIYIYIYTVHSVCHDSLLTSFMYI